MNEFDFRMTRVVIFTAAFFLLGTMSTCTLDDHLRRIDRIEKIKVLTTANVSEQGIACLVNKYNNNSTVGRACAAWIEKQ